MNRNHDRKKHKDLVTVIVLLRCVYFFFSTPSGLNGKFRRRASRNERNSPTQQSFPPTRVHGVVKDGAACLTWRTFVASCFRGALPPVDLRAVCFVRAIVSLTLPLFFLTYLLFFFWWYLVFVFLPLNSSVPPFPLAQHTLSRSTQFYTEIPSYFCMHRTKKMRKTIDGAEQKRCPHRNFSLLSSAGHWSGKIRESGKNERPKWM